MRAVPYILLALLYMISIPLLANEPLVKIAYPYNNSLHNETTVNVVINIDPESIDEIKIVASSDNATIDTVDSKNTYCKSIFLRLGENRIAVRVYKDKKMLDEQISRIYVSSEIYYEFRYPPVKYKQTFFHNDGNEAECAKCHDMTSNEVKGVAFVNVKKSNCYQCHNNITKNKFAHAPAVNWLCTSCHNGKTGSDNAKYAGKSKYIAAQPVNSVCFKCHKDNYKKWNSYRYRHEPLDSGHCNKCHNPHSSPYSMFVRKPVDQICLGCHKDKHIKSKRALKSGCAGTSKEKKCIKCHTPHASSKAFFIREADDKKEKKKDKKRKTREEREKERDMRKKAAS